MQHYAGYGLCIQSALPLPELIPVTGALPDLSIRWGETGRSRPAHVAANGYVDVAPGDAYLFWEQVGAFRVRDGQEIIVEPLPGVEERLLRLPLLGIVIGAALQQRGLLALHASAVAIHGEAVALLGASGAGKSTVAAALHARGHALVADDLVAVDLERDAVPMVLPAFPQLKLSPEAAAALLGDDPDSLPPLADGVPKRARQTIAGFSLQARPLSGVYVLSSDTAAGMTPLSPREAFLELVRHSYGIRAFSRGFGGVAARHMEQCARVVNHTFVRRLAREERLAKIQCLAWQIEQDLLSARPARWATPVRSVPCA